MPKRILIDDEVSNRVREDIGAIDEFAILDRPDSLRDDWTPDELADFLDDDRR